jgi:hypothetical protein
MATIIDTLYTLKTTEDRLVSTARDVAWLRDQGALMPSDLQRYDLLRLELYGAQLALYSQIVGTVRAMGVDYNPLLRQIPFPQMAPAISVSTAPRLGASGFGNPIIIVTALGEIAIPVWAVIVIALIAAVVIVASVIAIANAVVAADKVEAYSVDVANYYTTLRASFQQCRAGGGSVADCAALIHSIPTPREARPADPDTPLANPTDWPKWLAIGALASVAVVGLLTMLPFALRAAMSPPPPRRYTVD